MITVKVTYTIHEGHVSVNKQLIEAFLQDFTNLDNSRFLYTIFQKNDGCTFVHLSQYQDKAMQEELLKVPSFLQFQQERDKNLTGEPQIEILNYVAASRGVL
ncbi:hypothetical protein [Terrimonas ferruginea]|uniref:hypothetical protein n=1 Tax=Terrimonas ferruginea TaxID=249 RepID=UPI00041609A2|nr:hypothetical protein [Terrimonas ferruginea]